MLYKMDYKLNIACLVRVSHEEQVKFGYSIDAQKDALQKWADEKGYNIVGWYIDEGVSARKKVKNRPALQRLLADVQKGGIDMIVFTKLDRYFRSVSEYHETQKILEYNNTHWKAILEDYDTTTTDGRFKINLMLSIAEQEADRTADRIKFTFEHKIKKKQPISGSQPFGYKIGKNENGEKCVVIDETNADHVREIFDHFLKYNSVSAVTKYMIHERNVKICYNTIMKMLKNPYYFGHYRGVENYCPAYIDEKTHMKIQDILKNRNTKTRKTNRVYLFSGLLQCPECGYILVGAYTSKGKRGDYLTYRCNNCHKHKRCTFNRSFSENKLEKFVLDRIKPELEKYIAEIEIDAPKAAPTVDRSEIVAEMDRLNYMFRKNRISVDEYEKDYGALETKLEKLEMDEKPVDVSALRDFLNSDILDLYGGLSREDKRAAWRTIFDKIVMDKDGEHDIKFLKNGVL